MTRAQKILQRIIESPQVQLSLLKKIQGFDFQNRKKKVSIPPGSYIFIEFDELSPNLGIVSNVDTGDLYLVDMKIWKKNTK